MLRKQLKTEQYRENNEIRIIAVRSSDVRQDMNFTFCENTVITKITISCVSAHYKVTLNYKL